MRERALLRSDAICLAIPWCIELQRRAASFLVAMQGVVQQRLLFGFPDIVIGLEIPNRVEVWIGASALLKAVVEEVIKWIDRSSSDIGVAGQVEFRVKQSGLRNSDNIVSKPVRLILFFKGIKVCWQRPFFAQCIEIGCLCFPSFNELGEEIWHIDLNQD